MSNIVYFGLNATPENAELINKISEMLINNYDGSDTPINTEAVNDRPTKKAATKKKPAAKKKVEPKLTLADLKNAAKAAKSDHSEDFAKSVFNANDVDAPTLLKMCSAAPTEVYQTIIDQLAAGPAETEDDDDDWDDDDDGAEVPSDDEIKKALRAYKEEHGKDEALEILNENGAEKMSDIKNLSDEQKVDLFKALL